LPPLRVLSFQKERQPQTLSFLQKNCATTRAHRFVSNLEKASECFILSFLLPLKRYRVD
jgi:hypothetical protein